MHAATEIEMKMGLSGEQIAAMTTWLGEHGSNKGVVKHEEYYFNATPQADRSNLDLIIVGSDSDSEKKGKLVLAHQPSGKQREVREVEVENIDDMLTILKVLGYKNAARGSLYTCACFDPQKFLFQAEGFVDTRYTLRVRKALKDGKLTSKVCLKECHVDRSGETTHRSEFETKVSDGDAMIEILKRIGYGDLTPVQKTRHVYDVEHDGVQFEVVVDDVVGLGKFVEIELKSEVASVDVGRQMIYKLLLSSGIERCAVFTRNYFHLIYNSNVNFGREIVIEDQLRSDIR